MTFDCKILGAVKGNYQGADYYTLTLRDTDGKVADMTGKGDFDFLPFIDQDVTIELESTKSNGRFKFRAASAKPVKPAK